LYGELSSVRSIFLDTQKEIRIEAAVENNNLNIIYGKECALI
jgi:hypothetical protein